jgi:hypothetical protein
MRPIGCASPGCGWVGVTRGCCPPHYRQLLALVRAGETTWEKLESQGRCRPPNPEALRRYRAGRGLLATEGRR